MKVLLITPDVADAHAMQAALAAAGHCGSVCLQTVPPEPGGPDDPALQVDAVVVDAACLRAAPGWLPRLRAVAPGLPVLALLALLAQATAPALQAALAAGASDAVFQPLRGGELLIRLHMLAWRLAHQGGAPLVLGPWRIDLQAHRALRAGVPVELTAAEWRVLGLALARRGGLVTRRDLDAVLGTGPTAPASNRIEVHVSNLRRKLGPGLIETQRGLGYRIAG